MGLVMIVIGDLIFVVLGAVFGVWLYKNGSVQGQFELVNDDPENPEVYQLHLIINDNYLLDKKRIILQRK